MSMEFCPSETWRTLRARFERLYGDAADTCMERLRMTIGRYGVGLEHEKPESLWDHTDSVLITYGDTVRASGEMPLETLNRFCDERLQDTVSTVHILPFFPYSSDDGFSVIDYREVNPALGEWEHVEALGENFSLMFDLVLNHCSRKSSWARDYVNGILPAREYFIELDPATDLSAVVRPRPHPLLSPIQTRDGERHLWTTFSDDQLDLDFSNPDVFFEFLDIMFLYIVKGVRILRLDAIAYLWKELGTNCIHLPETHEVVKQYRTILELIAPHVILLTETNVPHEENMSYFGDGDEANMIYNFTLPPLLLHTLLNEDAARLTEWARDLPDPGPGRTYFNFTASHDGIGVRPLEGLVSDRELDALCDAVRRKGGHVSTKANSDGSESPYELNISYFDALCESETPGEADVARFLASQSIAMALKGVPAAYFHSLVATRNDYENVKRYGYPRAINRKKWNLPELEERLADPESHHAKVFDKYVERLRMRGRHPAFHPDGGQRVLDLGPGLFVVERTAPDGTEVVTAISNVTGKRTEVMLNDRFPTLACEGGCFDLITQKPRANNGANKLRLKPFETVWLVETGEVPDLDE
jgi:glycosidase